MQKRATDMLTIGNEVIYGDDVYIIWNIADNFIFLLNSRLRKPIFSRIDLSEAIHLQEVAS